MKTDVGQYNVFNVNYHGICSEKDGCTWDESKRVCEKEGGYLTKINSPEENDMVKEMFKLIDPNKKKFWFYIGLNDIENEGAYHWISDDSTVTFANWAKGNYLIPITLSTGI